jgi:hypothetical protein
LLSYQKSVKEQARRVFSWWRKLFPVKAEFSGAPRFGRLKTYSADSGYVFQYSLSSFRRHRGGDQVYEYVFLVSAGRGPAQPLSVLLGTSVLRQWQTQLGRELTASERFAIAKIALKRHLDESEAPNSVGPSVSPGLTEVGEISSFLGL